MTREDSIERHLTNEKYINLQIDSTCMPIKYVNRHRSMRTMLRSELKFSYECLAEVRDSDCGSRLRVLTTMDFASLMNQAQGGRGGPPVPTIVPDK